MHRQALIFCLLITVLLAGCDLLGRVKEQNDAGKNLSIAVDSNNKIYISSVTYDTSGQHLDLLTNVSGSWVLSRLETTYQIENPTQIVIDKNDKAHIIYCTTDTDHFNYVKYATNASGSWVSSSLTTSEVIGNSASHAVDNNGMLHVIFFRGFLVQETSIMYTLHLSLRYMNNLSGSWEETELDPDAGKSSTLSLALDQSGKVHISYFDGAELKLKYLTNQAGSWESTVIGSMSIPSLVVDSDNYVHICGSYGSSISYLTNASGTWESITVDANGDVGNYAALVVDHNNKVHIAHHEHIEEPTMDMPVYRGNLKYATNASGTWQNSTIFTNNK